MRCNHTFLILRCCSDMMKLNRLVNNVKIALLDGRDNIEDIFRVVHAHLVLATLRSALIVPTIPLIAMSKNSVDSNLSRKCNGQRATYSQNRSGVGWHQILIKRTYNVQT